MLNQDCWLLNIPKLWVKWSLYVVNYDVILWALLWTKREIRTIGPFHRIHIEKLCLDQTIWTAVVASGGNGFSFVVSKAKCPFVRVLWRLHRLVVFAIETKKYIFLRIVKRLLTNGILWHLDLENTAKLLESAQETYCMLDNWGRKQYLVAWSIDSQLLCWPSERNKSIDNKLWNRWTYIFISSHAPKIPEFPI